MSTDDRSQFDGGAEAARRLRAKDAGCSPEERAAFDGGAAAARRLLGKEVAAGGAIAMPAPARELVETMRAALLPLQHNPDALGFRMASDAARFTCAPSKAEILAANAAIEAADRALGAT